MRILQLIQCPQRRGAEIFACQLSIELNKLGHEVDIAYLYERKHFQLDYDLKFINLNAKREVRFWDFPAYKKLHQVIREGNYDLVQANASDTLKYAVISKLLYNWKSKLVFRNANKMSEFLFTPLHRYLNRFFLKKCDFIISVSENCRQDLKTFYSQALKKSSTITIGTYDFANIKPAIKANGAPILISVGSFAPEKNHLFLIDIFESVIQDFADAKLWLFGDGRMKDAINDKIRDHNLGDNIIMWGNRPDVVSYLKSSDVLLMPSRIEGLPGAIFESMSCNVPVIAAPVGGIPEIIKHGETGFSPVTFDVDEYHRYIKELFTQDDLREKITRNANKLIKENFLMPKIAEQFENTYSTLIGR